MWMLFLVMSLDENPPVTRMVGGEMGAEMLRAGDEEKLRETKEWQ